MKDYLYNKYDGLQEIPVEYLRHELLLDDKEYKKIKRQVMKRMKKTYGELFLSFDMFARIVEHNLRLK